MPQPHYTEWRTFKLDHKNIFPNDITTYYLDIHNDLNDIAGFRYLSRKPESNGYTLFPDIIPCFANFLASENIGV